MIDRHDGGMEFEGRHPASEQFRREFPTVPIREQDLHSPISSAVEEMLRREELRRAQEDALWIGRMLADPLLRGLIVVGPLEGEVDMDLQRLTATWEPPHYEYELSADVPYMQRLVAPSWEAVEQWRERGRPL